MIQTQIKPAVFQPSADKPAHWMVGDRITVLISGEQTNGAYAVLEAFTVAGGGPPPHIHRREDEMFYVLDGDITIFAGDQVVHATPGTCAHVPAGVVHHFKNEGDKPVRMVFMYTPGGFETYFPKAGTPTTHRDDVAPPVTPETIKRLQAHAAQYHLEFVPLPEQ